MSDTPLVQAIIIDVATEARALGLGDLIPDGAGAEHDYRLSARTPFGGEITFNRYATATDIAAYWLREGWLSQDTKRAP
jgi:hypothetical protein